MTTSAAGARHARPVPTQPTRSTRPAPVRAELLRFSSRRFLRLLFVLAVLGWAVATVGCAFVFAKTTPAGEAAARVTINRFVTQQNEFRTQCLADRGVSGVSGGDQADQVCGPVATADQFQVADYLPKRPFLLAVRGPDGAVAVGVGVAVLGFLVGASWIGAEWSSRAIVGQLFWEPRRLPVMARKLLVLLAAVAVLGIVLQLLWTGSALLLAHTNGSAANLPTGFWRQLVGDQARAVALACCAAVLGFGLANLVRNTGAALGIGFVYFAVVETAVRILRPSWERGLLSANAIALVDRHGYRYFLYQNVTTPGGQFGSTVRQVTIHHLPGGLVLTGVALVVTGISVLLFRRRDVQ